jgi:glycosyltransferase involved in cell wall biosynthesis
LDELAEPSVLHIIFTPGATSAQLNEHCLPLAGIRRLGVCSYFAATVAVPEDIALFEGDGTVRGFLRALGRAGDAGFDVAHLHGAPLALLFGGSRLARGRGVGDAVFTVHTSYGNISRRDRVLLHGVCAAFPRVVFCGASSYASAPAWVRRLAGRRARVIPNGVDVARIARASGRDGSPGDTRFCLVTVGRLIEAKNTLATVQVLEALDRGSSRLVIIGDGPERAALEHAVQRAGLVDEVTFAGALDRDAVYGTLMTADLFVSASRVEGLPVSVLEAMAAGLPLVLSDIPPHREVTDGCDGVQLIDPDDTPSFAQAIERVRRLPEAERERLGAGGRRVVASRYGVDDMLRRYTATYEDVIAARQQGKDGNAR